MEASELEDALKRVAKALKQSGKPFALAGSFALWARGGPPPTHDVDFVVREQDVKELTDALVAEGLELMRPPEDWLWKVEVGAVTVDLLFDLATLRAPVAIEDLLGRANVIDVLSVHIPVLSATDVLVAKLSALSEHYCDFANLLPVVRAVREQVDWPAIAKSTEWNDFAAAFLFLIARLGILPK